MKLFGRNKIRDGQEATVVLWPDAAIEVDDDDFAQAIARGREEDPEYRSGSMDHDADRLSA